MDQLELQNAVGVDDKYAAKRHVLPSDVDAVGLTHFPVFVSGQGKLQSANAAVGSRSREPTLVRLERIRINTQYIAFSVSEFFDATADRSQFGRSDEREVPGIEHQHQPTILVIRQTDLTPARFLSRSAN